MILPENNKMEFKQDIDILPFLHNFFTNHHCSIQYVDRHHLHVQLTEEMDKALMNRPFYWQYIKATGHPGTPQTLTFTTKATESTDSEWIHHGSPRLQQIYNYILQNNRIIQLFEVHQTDKRTLLQPWLLTNYSVLYEGKLKKEYLYSIGLNLINGTMTSKMMERLENTALSPAISNYCYTISPLITWQSGFKRIEQFITEQITAENHEWAEESIQVMKEEIDMAHHFYGNDQEEQLNKEITDIKIRLQPTITHKVINGGILYLSKDYLNPVT